MKLYSVVGSGNCRKVLATINHLGCEVEIENLDFFAGDLNKPDYMSLNPNARVPTLTDGDFSLWESNAIMQYLADKVPGNDLFPHDPQTRADIVRWQCWELAHFNSAFGTLVFETVLKPIMQQEPDQGLIAFAQESLVNYAKVLDEHLQSRQFVVSEHITLADYSIIQIEAFKETIPFDWSTYSAINDYFERMRSAEHWQKNTPESAKAIEQLLAAL